MRRTRMGAVQELPAAARAAADSVGPSVVRIGRGGGRGCGVIVADGLVATNAHNLRGDEATVTFDDGRAATGTVAGIDVDGDLAVLRVDTGGAAAVNWADGEGATTGDVVFAVTRSAAGGTRVSFGLVSATERAFRGPRGRRITGSVEHTAPLVRGSSGGPIVDAEGRLLGLNTNRLGLGLAPSAVARKLRRSVGLPERDGLLVRVVEEGGPADRAGVKRGDLIVEAAGSPVTTTDELYGALDRAGEALTLKIVRGVDELEVRVSFAADGGGAGEA